MHPILSTIRDSLQFVQRLQTQTLFVFLNLEFWPILTVYFGNFFFLYIMTFIFSLELVLKFNFALIKFILCTIVTLSITKIRAAIIFIYITLHAFSQFLKLLLSTRSCETTMQSPNFSNYYMPTQHMKLGDFQLFLWAPLKEAHLTGNFCFQIKLPFNNIF